MPHPDTRHHRNGAVQTPRQYEPSGYAYAAYKQTISMPGDYGTGYITGREADHLLRRAKGRGLVIRPDILGTFTLHKGGRETTAWALASLRTVTLTPVTNPQKITTRQYDDLMLILAMRTPRLDRSSGQPVIVGELSRIPAGATDVLRRKGWISETPHTGQLTVSSAGLMALAARDHVTAGLDPRLLKGIYLDAALNHRDVP
ncbi:hypothetical protein [Streptomyces sp. CS014]|uniref:hypothetical protein n=1 Tax=Streptomyces sp. CS014 TaxID=2162707 RepID=UPI000D51F126|nr:hypothetical protein [Streptomyces sp. CS014]PVD04503.1 hypothetical protein DBP12_03495 [Streptomyces sp. CS014]